MRRVFRIVALVVAVFATTLPAGVAGAAPGESLIVTGVVDGPLSGGIPKVIELYAVSDIADLSDFGVGAANNGGGTDGEEFTFPAVSLTAGDYIYVASESTGFTSFFGFAPDYTSSAASINGDDAIEVFHLGEVVDLFGDINVDGSGTDWDYLDGWAKRIDRVASTSFDVANWEFSGANALDGATTNASAGTPFPLADETAPEPEPEPEPQEVFIHQVQGAGFVSPLVDAPVIIEGVVVGDQETFDRLAGFFVQEEDVDADADPATSEGVFVFNSFRNTVSIGDVVRVEGVVSERFGNTQVSAESVVVIEEPELSEKDRTVTPATVEFPLSASGDLEAVEGMSAIFPQTLVVSEYFNYDRFGEVVVALPFDGEDRPFTPTAVAEPNSTEMFDRLEWNQLSRITIDDAITTQNPDDVVHPINRDPFTLDNRFRGGDEVSGLVGPIYFDFSLYRLLPTGFETYDRTERPDEHDEVGGRLKVGTLNALNYFLTLDDGTNDICGTSQTLECRGADTVEEFERQRAKLLAALIGMDADVVGLVEVENTPGVSPLADIVDGLNDALGPNTYNYIDTGAVGSDAIKVGIIYKPAAVTQIGLTAVLDSPEFLNPRGADTDRNRAAVAATFLEKGTGEKFSVVVNHLKSKGSGCGAGDDDPFAGSCNLTRTLAAEVLADWIGTDPTNSKDTDWLVIGDLNSYDKEDPIDVLVDAGYTDLLAEHVGEFAYTFVFDGQFGYLDYAMSSSSMTDQVTGATAWNINADEPDLLDYDTSFKSDTQDALYEPNAFRSSDHDAVLVGLSLNEKPGRGNKR